MMRSPREHDVELPATARRAVLVVDDHPANLVAIREVLAPTGLEVSCVGSGEEALRAVLARDFAVILLDLRMAPMTGLETARLLRTRDRLRRTPLVFVTAADVTVEEIRAAYDAGAADFLTKPLVPEILRAKVNVFVELAAARDELREQEARRRAAELEALSSQTQAQQRELARWQKLFQHAGWGMVMIDPEDDRILQCNPAFARMHGYEPEELLGHPVTELFGKSSRQEFVEKTRTTIAAGSHSYEQVHLRKDGTEFPVIADAVALSDEHGRLVFRGASIQDLTERKQLEQALRDSEAESRSIVERLAEGVMIVDRDGRITKANPGAGRILGVPPEALVGRSIHTNDWSASREDGSDFPHDDHPARQALATGEARTAVLGLRMPVDRTVWLLLNAQPFRRSGTASVSGVVLSFFDITERREAELARRHTQELLRTLVDAMPMLVSYVSYDGTELRYALNNLTYEKWLGVDRVGTTGRTMREVLGDAAFEAIRPYVEAVLRGQTVSYQRELPYRTGPRMVEATYIPHVADDGKVIGFVVIVQDIGERIRGEREKAELLRREQAATARLRLLARASRSLSEVSLRTDEVFRVVAETLTESFATYCGVFAVTEAGLLSTRGISHRDPESARTLRMLMATAGISGPRPQIREALERGELVTLGEEALPQFREQLPELHRAFLALHPVRELLYAPLRVGPRFIGMLAMGRGPDEAPFDEADRLFVQDLAERGALALEAARLYDEEKKAKEAALLRADFEERFIGIVSHDIRSPVTALKMASLLLRRSPELTASAATQLDRIDRCARRVEQITSLLMDFTRARIGSGIGIHPRQISLAELCAKAVEEQQLAHPERQLRSSGDAHVEADPGRVTQALVNLVENAIKYGAPDEEIQVRAEQLPDGGAAISVHNRGPPIDRIHISNLFQPFARGAQTEQTVKLSLGLGLFIVREIARAHGGDVGVVSSPEHGTTFTFTLPARPHVPEAQRVR